MNIILRDLSFLFRVINLRLGITWRHISAFLLSFAVRNKHGKWMWVERLKVVLFDSPGASTNFPMGQCWCSNGGLSPSSTFYVVFCLLLRPFILLMRQFDNKAFHNLNNSIFSFIYLFTQSLQHIRPLILKGKNDVSYITKGSRRLAFKLPFCFACYPHV